MNARVDKLNAFIDEHQKDLFDPGLYSERAFSAAEYAQRLAALRASMESGGVDLMIVTAPDTLAWLHGYRSRWYRQHTSTSLPPGQCTVISVAGDLFMIEAAYHEDLVRATSIVEDIRVLPTGDMFHEPGLSDYIDFLLEQISGVVSRPATIGLELWSCLPSPAVSRQIEDALTANGHRIVDVTIPVRQLRTVKSPAEIVMIENAQYACDAGLLALREQLRPGMTELEAWAVFVSASVAAGGEPAALHETVAAGPLMPSLHRISSRRPLATGDIFHADAASSYFGYHARGTRPYFFGAPPSELVELTEIAAGAYEVLTTVGRAGTAWQELFAALRDYYSSTGVEGGAAGYELGVTVPPADWVNELLWGTEDTSMTGTIQAGTVTNFESFNVVALVDTVVFGEESTRILSRVPRELLTIQER